MLQVISGLFRPAYRDWVLNIFGAIVTCKFHVNTPLHYRLLKKIEDYRRLQTHGLRMLPSLPTLQFPQSLTCMLTLTVSMVKAMSIHSHGFWCIQIPGPVPVPYPRNQISQRNNVTIAMLPYILRLNWNYLPNKSIQYWIAELKVTN